VRRRVPLAARLHKFDGERKPICSTTRLILMETASHISKGLHRYETFKNDAHGCKECQGMWDEMKRTDEQQLERVVNHLKEHFARGADAKAKAA
jgi:hypothetical protein